MVWRTKMQARVEGSSFFHFFAIFHYFLVPLLLKFCENRRNVMH